MTENHCPSCRRPLPPEAPGGLCPVCVLSGAREESLAGGGAPPLEEIRAAFPQLEVLECIGRGGMGVVYKARQLQLDRLVALKILLPGLDHDAGFAERFAREARALAKLGHPHIVAVYDFGETAGFFWLTMEYVDGVNLRQAMRAARFTPPQALAIIPDLCAALQYAHDHGVLHRDIKPENILLDAAGRVKVADFGIARIAGEEGADPMLTLTGAALGSVAYVAPEQIENPRAVDHRADLYSMGVIFYEMLTGELPLGRFAAPSEKSASDPRLDEVVFRSLEKEREKRFQQAADFSAGVADAGTGGAVAARIRRPPLPLPMRIQAWAAVGLTGFSLLLGLPILALCCYAWVRGEMGGLGGQELLVIFFGVLLPAAGGMLLGGALLVALKRSAGRRAIFSAFAWPVILGSLAPVLALPAAGAQFQLPVAAGMAALLIWAVWRSFSERRAGVVERSRPGLAALQETAKPWLVPWAVGLMLAGGTALGLALAVARVSFAIPGATALVLGFAGAWWALGLMRAGRLAPRGRWLLLLLVVWLPALGAAGTFAACVADEPVKPFQGKGDLIANGLLVFGLSFVAALPLFLLGSLPKSLATPGGRRGRRVAGGLSLLLTGAALIDAKVLDGHWPATGYYREVQIYLQEPKEWRKGSADLESPVRTAMQRAAGEYADRFFLTNDGGKWTIGILTTDRKSWERHLAAFTGRLTNALPEETAAMSTVERLKQEPDSPMPPGNPDWLPRMIVLSAMALAGVLAAVCAFAPLSIVAAGFALVGSLAMILTPVAGGPNFYDRRRVEGPPLLPLERGVGPADLTTPVGTARFVCEMAWAGREDGIARGFSRRLQQEIARKTGWGAIVRRLGDVRRSIEPDDGAAGENRQRVRLRTLYGTRSLGMILEDGEWRIDELPFSLDELE